MENFPKIDPKLRFSKRDWISALLNEEKCAEVARGDGLKIIIIGAGPAGLAAGATLRRTLPGAKVKLIEARERIGGRVLTGHFPLDANTHKNKKDSHDCVTIPKDESCSVDLGAAYVHGCNITNPLWRQATCQNKVLDTTAGGYSIGWGENCVWRSSDGRVVQKKSVSRAFQIAWRLKSEVETSLIIQNPRLKTNPLFGNNGPSLKRKEFREKRFQLNTEKRDTNLRDAVDEIKSKRLRLLRRPLTDDEIKVLKSTEVLIWSYVAPMHKLSTRVLNEIALPTLDENNTTTTTTTPTSLKSTNPLIIKSMNSTQSSSSSGEDQPVWKKDNRDEMSANNLSFQESFISDVSLKQENDSDSDWLSMSQGDSQQLTDSTNSFNETANEVSDYSMNHQRFPLQIDDEVLPDVSSTSKKEERRQRKPTSFFTVDFKENNKPKKRKRKKNCKNSSHFSKTISKYPTNDISKKKMKNIPSPLPINEKKLSWKDGLVKNGYFDLVCSPLSQGLHIQFGSIVKHIYWDNDICRIISIKNQLSSCQSNKYEIDDENNPNNEKKIMNDDDKEEDIQIDECDFVIIALPLGVLKSKHDYSKVNFHPSLPQRKLDAIENIGFGSENKIILRFSTIFWEEDEPYLQTLDERFRILNGFYFGKGNTLVLHASPPFGHGYDGLDDEAVIQECLRCLRGMYSRERLHDDEDDDYVDDVGKPMAKNRNNHKKMNLLKKSVVPDPVWWHVTRWDQDPFSMGAYSYWAEGMSLDHVTNMAAPEPCVHTPTIATPSNVLTTPKLYFCGEHATIRDAQCVHGACNSGERAARQASCAALGFLEDLSLCVRTGESYWFDPPPPSDSEINKKKNKNIVQRKQNDKNLPVTGREILLDSRFSPFPSIEAVSWHEAGKWMFDCPCGVTKENFDDGTAMLQCEKCNKWQHATCMKIYKKTQGINDAKSKEQTDDEDDDSETEKEYQCYRCSHGFLNVDTFPDSKIQLKSFDSEEDEHNGDEVLCSGGGFADIQDLNENDWETVSISRDNNNNVIKFKKKLSNKSIESDDRDEEGETGSDEYCSLSTRQWNQLFNQFQSIGARLSHTAQLAMANSWLRAQYKAEILSEPGSDEGGKSPVHPLHGSVLS